MVSIEAPMTIALRITTRLMVSNHPESFEASRSELVNVVSCTLESIEQDFAEFIKFNLSSDLESEKCSQRTLKRVSSRETR